MALAPHALAITTYADSFNITEPAALLMNQVGHLYLSRAQFLEAEPPLRRALEINEQFLGPDDAMVATNLNNLAMLLHDTNRLAEAEPLYRRALMIDHKNFGANDSRIATNLSNLALLLQDTGRLAEAEPLIRRAVAIWEQSGSDHAKTALAAGGLVERQDTGLGCDRRISAASIFCVELKAILTAPGCR